MASALDYYTDDLGFRIDVIYPADAPREAKLSGHGIDIRLESSAKSQHTREGEWGTGRAGMQYRDLVPDRLGGRFIASHIRIPKGGPVPDYVHYHDIQFQMIYCYRGWVRVVYEDQGPPFVMEAGDCVLQPPHIRHRVVECSDNMEVIEVSSPAEHETHVDHSMVLPTADVDVDRDFGGQRFVRHQSGQAQWLPGPHDGFEARDSGIGTATDGLASVQVIRLPGQARATIQMRGDEFLFLFVLQGAVTLQRQGDKRKNLGAGESFVVSNGVQVTISAASSDLEILHVASNLESNR